MTGGGRSKLGAVLPLALDGSYGVDDLGRAELLFRSLARFGAGRVIDPILVVMPAAQVEQGQRALARWRGLGVAVMSEEEMLPSFRRFPHVRGWRKQQLIKIAAARWMDRSYYVTLDADVVLTRPLSADELLPGGVAATQYCRLREHPRWWRSSARLLGLPRDFLAALEVGLHATPAILSGAICRALMDGLLVAGGSPRERESWDVQLLNLHGSFRPTRRGIERWRMRKWTEYSLYYLFALDRGLWSGHHAPPRPVVGGTLNRPMSAFFPNERFCPELVEAHLADPNRPPFAVVGTKGVLGLEELEQELMPRVESVGAAG